MAKEVNEVRESSPRDEHKPPQASRTPPAHTSWRDRPSSHHSEGRRAHKSQPKNSSDKGSAALPTSDSSWLAQQKAHRRTSQTGDAAESVSTEEVVRTMKSILNKLTIEKFEPLYAKLVACGIHTTVHLEALIHEVFEKATMQHHFVSMYADLCVRLHFHFSEHPITDDPKMTFKKILLNGCQAFFEKHLKPPANLKELDEEERLALSYKYKTQMLGNIKFVGALLVRQMLATKVLFAICEELLQDPTPESLESLASLLTVVGPKLDMPETQAHAMLSEVFSRVKLLTQLPEIKCRERCLLKDVLELRACRWRDRKPKQIEGPSTLKEVADTQAAEVKATGPSGKASSNAARKSSGKAQSKVWPGQGQGTKFEKVTGRKTSSLASDLVTRSPPSSPKCAAPKEVYARINSLAALKGDSKGTPSKDSSERPRKQPSDERPRKQPNEEEPFDKEACRKEVSDALAELRVTHEVAEAILRISALSVPSSKQSEELCDMLAHMAEEGSASARKASFNLVAGLFTEGHWKPYALGRGLQDFVEAICPDIKLDVPMLPNILRDELCPALEPLVDSGQLQRSHFAALAIC